VDGIAGGFFADVSAFGIGKARDGVTDIDMADVGGLALKKCVRDELLRVRMLSRGF
jgi:hypothetical protein